MKRPFAQRVRRTAKRAKIAALKGVRYWPRLRAMKERARPQLMLRLQSMVDLFYGSRPLHERQRLAAEGFSNIRVPGVFDSYVARARSKLPLGGAKPPSGYARRVSGAFWIRKRWRRGFVEHEWIHSIKVSNNNLLTANAVESYISFMDSRERRGPNFLDDLRQAQIVHYGTAVRFERRASEGGARTFDQLLIRETERKAIESATRRKLGQKARVFLADEDLMLFKPMNYRISGGKLGSYASLIEFHYGKPGFGLFLIKLVGEGRKIEEAEREILSGAHDKEMHAYVEKYRSLFGW